MCKRETYKRFLKIYEFVKDNKDDEINGRFVRSFVKYFNTKLGKRRFHISKRDKEIYVSYWDFDKTMLFEFYIYKSGKIDIKNSKIDQPEIFLAIYEIENIINNKKQKYKDNILEKLFENIDEFSFIDRIFG